MTSNESYIFLAVFAALALIALIYLLSPMSLPDEPLLYLIGVNHAVQFKDAQTQMLPAWEPESVRKTREAFKAHVAEMIDTLDIEILAEEFSEEAKTRWRVSESVLERLAKTKGIEHRFCDPDTKEREALGIEDPDSKHGRAQREQVWLSRIADCKLRRVLFVCGDEHYADFAQLLESNGFNVQRGPLYPISVREFVDLERTSPDVSPRR